MQLDAFSLNSSTYKPNWSASSFWSCDNSCSKFDWLLLLFLQLAWTATGSRHSTDTPFQEWEWAMVRWSVSLLECVSSIFAFCGTFFCTAFFWPSDMIGLVLTSCHFSFTTKAACMETNTTTKAMETNTTETQAMEIITMAIITIMVTVSWTALFLKCKNDARRIKTCRAPFLSIWCSLIQNLSLTPYHFFVLFLFFRRHVQRIWRRLWVWIGKLSWRAVAWRPYDCGRFRFMMKSEPASSDFCCCPIPIHLLPQYPANQYNTFTTGGNFGNRYNPGYVRSY